MRQVALDILDHLDAITSLQDCAGVRRFHRLKGQRRGEYAMNTTGNYSISFMSDGEQVHDVNLEDYH